MKLFIAATAFSVLAFAQFARAAVVNTSDKKVKIAFIAAYTGTDPNTSRELERGMDSYLKAHSELAKHLEVSRLDNKGSLSESVAIIDKLKKTGTDIIIGLARSDEAVAAAKEAAGTGALFVTPFATNPAVSKQGEFIFQVCFNDDFQGRALGALTKDLAAKRVLILTNLESIYSVGLSQSTQKSIEATRSAHAQIKNLTYTENDLNIPTAIAAVKEFKPDFVLITDHITRAARLAKALRTVDPNIKFIGGDGFGGQKILGGIFQDSPGIELFYTTHWSKSLPGKVNNVFIKAYETIAPGETPTTGAAMTFDAFKIVGESLEALNFRDDPAAIASYIRHHHFEVTTGTIEISKGASGPEKAAVVMHLKKGEYGVYKTLKP